MISNWLQAARLRTLPLSMSGIILGSCIARWELKNSGKDWDWRIFALAMIVTLLYQVLSNFANDYGDSVKGTDSNRVSSADKRTIASGKITLRQMKIAIISTTILALLLTALLLYVAFLPGFTREFWIFIGLGFASILAAIGYTIGKKPYGYFGLGDIMVFIFFGLVSVIGSYFLFTKSLNEYIYLPAMAVGLLSTAVLNLNNMRDVENDILHNKKTFAAILGFKIAMIYQMVLLQLPFILILIWLGLQGFFKVGKYQVFSVMILMFPLMQIRRKILATKNPELLDPFLKKIGIITLAMALILGITLNYYG